MEVIDRIKAGCVVAFTPDGPKGPCRSIQPGVMAAAAKPGAPIVPIAWSGNRVKELGTWDRFLIPLPFGRYKIVYDKPIYVRESSGNSENLVREALLHVEREVQR